ncbi:MAG: DUF4124 domain-containing protein [Clostridia bacterium]
MMRAAAFLLTFLVAGAAQAQVFKCVDASGKTVYSQVPCPKGAKSSTLSNSAPAAPAAAPSGKAAPLTPAEVQQQERLKASKKADEDKKAAENAARSAQFAENCKRAKEQLAAYEAGGRVTRLNASGERYYLSDEDIEREKASARAAVSANCQ